MSSYNEYDEDGYKEWNPQQALENLTMEKALDGLDNPIKLSKRLFDENLPLSTMAICHLAVHSPNEGIRFNAAKYVVDRTMGPVSGTVGANDDGTHVWQTVYDAVLMEASSYLEGSE